MQISGRGTAAGSLRAPAFEAWPEQDLSPEFEGTLRKNALRTIQDLAKAASVDAPIAMGTGTVPDVVREVAIEQATDLIVIGRGVMQGTMGRLRTHAGEIIPQRSLSSAQASERSV